MPPTRKSGVDARVSETLHQYDHCRENDWAYLCALNLSNLITAREVGLIDDIEVDEEEARAHVASRMSNVEQQWDAKFTQLHRVLTHRSDLEDEEAVLVLSLRSGLEAAARFLDEARRQRLRDELDPSLLESIKDSHAVVTSLQRRGSADVACLLPSHWWWHENR